MFWEELCQSIIKRKSGSKYFWVNSKYRRRRRGNWPNPVRYDWLVTVVTPVKEIENLYEEMIDGQDDQSDSTDEQ